jgi:hypothetical protein
MYDATLDRANLVLLGGWRGARSDRAGVPVGRVAVGARMKRLLYTLILMTALWDSAISATIQWSQDGRSCLYKETALHERGFIGCYEKAGTITLQLGGAQTDGNFRPRSGDVYILVSNGVTTRAPLVGRPVYLPVIR